MRAVRFENGSVRVVETEAARGEGVRVRVRACGLCGSDLAMLDAGFALGGIPGHEIAGELDDGTPVAIEPLATCGRCEFCRVGDYEVCRLGNAAILGVGRDGGMADEVWVPERCLVRLPRGVAVRDACLVEPLAVAVHGLRRAHVHGAQRLVVIGGGAIGLCAVAAARAAGCEVALVARHEAQVRAGALLGAVDPDGREYDVAIECAGTASAAAEACARLRPNGTFLMLASCWDQFSVPGLVLGAKELTIVASLMYGRSGSGRDADAAAALLAATPELASTLITHRFPLEAAAEAFAAARDRKRGAIKVVLEPARP
jgi:threonine dehydrogenase-like Zn-dependent dehydrogenase